MSNVRSSSGAPPSPPTNPAKGSAKGAYIPPVPGSSLTAPPGAKGGGKGTAPPVPASPSKGQQISGKGSPPPPIPGKGKGPPVPSKSSGKGGSPPPPSSKGGKKGKKGKGGGPVRLKVSDLPFNRRLNLRPSESPERIKDTIYKEGFEKVKGTIPEFVSEEDFLKEHFKKPEVAKKGKTEKPDAEDSHQEVKFFSSSQVQNFLLVWNQIKPKMSMDQLVHHLTTLEKCDELDSDELARFCSVMPPVLDMQALSKYNGKEENLREMERLLYPISKMHRAPQRFQALIAYSKIDSIMDEQKRFQQILVGACEELKSSEFLQIVLTYLMIFYSYANFNEVPSSIDDIKSFDAMQVMEFASVKTYQPRRAPTMNYNVFHWAWQETGKVTSIDISRTALSGHFENLVLASRLPFGDVVAPLGDLKELFMSLRRELKEYNYNYCECEKCQAQASTSLTSSSRIQPKAKAMMIRQASMSSPKEGSSFADNKNALAGAFAVLKGGKGEKGASGKGEGKGTVPQLTGVSAKGASKGKSGPPPIPGKGGSPSPPASPVVIVQESPSSPAQSPPRPRRMSASKPPISPKANSPAGSEMSSLQLEDAAKSPVLKTQRSSSNADSPSKSILLNRLNIHGEEERRPSSKSSRRVSFSEEASPPPATASLDLTPEEKSALLQEIDQVQQVRSRLQGRVAERRRRSSLLSQLNDAKDIRDRLDSGSGTAETRNSGSFVTAQEEEQPPGTRVFKDERQLRSQNTPENEEDIKAELLRLSKAKREIVRDYQIVDGLQEAQKHAASPQARKSLELQLKKLAESDPLQPLPTAESFHRRRQEQAPKVFHLLAEVETFLNDRHAKKALQDAQASIAQMIAEENEFYARSTPPQSPPAASSFIMPSPNKRHTTPDLSMAFPKRRQAVKPQDQEMMMAQIQAAQIAPLPPPSKPKYADWGLHDDHGGLDNPDYLPDDRSEIWQDPHRKGLNLPDPYEILRSKYKLFPGKVHFKSSTLFLSSWKQRWVSLFGTNLALYSDQEMFEEGRPLLVLPLFGAEFLAFSDPTASSEAHGMSKDYPSGFQIILDDVHVEDGYFSKENNFYAKNVNDLALWRKIIEDASEYLTLCWGYLQVNGGAVFRVWIYLNLERRAICCYNNPKHFHKKPSYVSGPQYIALEDVDVEVLSQQKLDISGDAGGFRMVYLRGDRIGQEVKIGLDDEDLVEEWSEWLVGSIDDGEEERKEMMRQALTVKGRGQQHSTHIRTSTSPAMQPEYKRPSALPRVHDRKESSTGFALQRVEPRQHSSLTEQMRSVPLPDIETPALLSLKEKLKDFEGKSVSPKHAPRRLHKPESSRASTDMQVQSQSSSDAPHRPRRLHKQPKQESKPPAVNIVEVDPLNDNNEEMTEIVPLKDLSKEENQEMLQNLQEVEPQQTDAQGDTIMLETTPEEDSKVAVVAAGAKGNSSKGSTAKGGKGVPPPVPKGKGKGDNKNLAPVMTLAESDSDSDSDDGFVDTLAEAHKWIDLDMGECPTDHDIALQNLWRICVQVRDSAMEIIAMINSSEQQCVSTLKYFGKILPPKISPATRQETINQFFQVYASAIKVFCTCASELEQKRKYTKRQGSGRKIADIKPPSPPTSPKRTASIVSKIEPTASMKAKMLHVAATVDFSKQVPGQAPTMKELKQKKKLLPGAQKDVSTKPSLRDIAKKVNNADKPSLRNIVNQAMKKDKSPSPKMKEESPKHRIRMLDDDIQMEDNNTDSDQLMSEHSQDKVFARRMSVEQIDEGITPQPSMSPQPSPTSSPKTKLSISSSSMNSSPTHHPYDADAALFSDHSMFQKGNSSVIQQQLSRGEITPEQAQSMLNKGYYDAAKNKI